MRKRKLIGIMIAQPEEQYQTMLLSGITQHAFELNYDCAVFSLPIKDAGSDEIHAGAFNMFNLINFDRLDALIVVPDTFSAADIREKTLALIRENFSGPVVSVDMKFGGLPFIESNDTALVEAITDHLIEAHGFTVLDFMLGVPDHEHSLRRFEGFKHSLAKHGLEFDERRVHDGDFWYGMGEKTVREILSSDLPLPQAVVCASDTMAISVCEAFAQHGISVPDQVAVTGYDRIPEGRNHVPSITSATYPAKQTGINAVQYLHSQLENIPFESCDGEISLLLTQSCGCGTETDDEYHNSFSHCDGGTISGSAFFSSQNFMMNKLISSNSIEELVNFVNWHTFQIKPYNAFYLCLCDDWDGWDREDGSDCRSTGYTDVIRLRITRFVNDDGCRQIVDEPFDKSVMLPDLDADRGEPAVYYFSPIFFNAHTFGYAVMKYTEPKSLNYEYRSWLSNVSNGFECIRRQLHIKSMYRQLRITALTDSLTGLYNRNAFNHYVDSLSERLAGGRVKVMFMMTDLNFLKVINDVHGHLAGDTALRAVAEALKSVCGENENCYRFGGDEFMIIGDGEYTEEMIEKISAGIQDYLNRFNSLSKLPFDVTASLGAVCAEVCTPDDIDRIIREADCIMYENKRRNRSG